MNKAWFRFYAELNDFLPYARKSREFLYEFEGHPSLKDAIESIGIPHPEVDLILVDGESKDFTGKVHDGSHISVYPVFESFDVSDLQHLRGEPLRDIKFILDVHLGKLARYLRLFGFDAHLDTSLDDIQIIELAAAQKRIILTRDKMLLKNSRVTHGYFVRSTNPRKQAEEIFERMQLDSKVKAFTRCLECNALIEDISKEEIIDKIPEKTRIYFDRFWICPNCRRIYWKGSHYDRMMEFARLIQNKIH